MKLVKWGTAIIAVTILAGCQSTKDLRVGGAERAVWPEMDAVVESGIREQHYPGAVLIIGRPGEVLYARAYGRTSWSPKAPATTMNTIYDLASVSKVVGTAAASWLLVEDGSLSLDARVADYLPEFSQSGKDTVTVRDLLTHVSGLPAYESFEKVERTRRTGETPANALLRHYSTMAPVNPPREKFTYSCLNYQTLARLNEKVAGTRQEDLLVKRIFSAMDMRDTRYTLSPEQASRVAPTHIRADGTLSTVEVHDPLARYHGSWEHCPGNAGLFSTGPDLAKFCEMVLSDGVYKGRRVLRSHIVRQATLNHNPQPVTDQRGLGWDIYEELPYATELNHEPGAYVLGHTGYTGTLLLLDQKTETYLVFLTNRTLPAQPGIVEQNPSVQPVRGQIWDLVMKSQPTYARFYETAAESVRRANGTYSTGGS